MYLRPGFVVVIVGATLTSLSTIVVALRYYCRHVLMGSLGASDHLMLVALILSWANFTTNYYQDETSRSYRPSFFRIPEKRPQIEAAVRGSLITWWAYRMGYIIALGFVKLSILFFYRAIASHRTFRRLVNFSIVFVSLYTFASAVASAFQCQNPSDSWSTVGYFAQFDRDPTTKRPKLKCYDPIKLWVFSAAINLLSDIVILLLPIPALLSLRVPMSKRLALIGIFSIGIMAIVASSIRMWVMMLWAESPWNSARYGADLLLWGQVETNSGIISASVPFLRSLFLYQRKNERGVTQRRVQESPPKPMGQEPVSQNRPLDKPLEVDTWALCEVEKESGEGDPGWQPFITVPESISSGSRGSALLEPVHLPHGAV
ncbi:hypothetical protein FB567DRAFT_597949 [Paraphoma chrysanthemicola]|uniref:Rhodopsin domain-containing protein n=1 Tax=Paraphoma chrysanthemicola TaxID=798071 RepID=A0A8K0QX11_9PLEO|nr:hypothetical protein FB567DRAFT_597949 [Paraphoma chrysanthemicola]